MPQKKIYTYSSLGVITVNTDAVQLWNFAARAPDTHTSLILPGFDLFFPAAYSIKPKPLASGCFGVSLLQVEV